MGSLRRSTHTGLKPTSTSYGAALAPLGTISGTSAHVVQTPYLAPVFASPVGHVSRTITHSHLALVISANLPPTRAAGQLTAATWAWDSAPTAAHTVSGSIYSGSHTDWSSSWKDLQPLSAEPASLAQVTLRSISQVEFYAVIPGAVMSLGHSACARTQVPTLNFVMSVTCFP